MLDERDTAFLRSFTEGRRWQFARTRPWNPHEYTVRDWVRTPEGYAEFDTMLELVATKGFTAPWGKRLWPYVDFEGFTYFTFGAALDVTTIVNRKPTDAVEGDRDAPSWAALGHWEPGAPHPFPQD